MEKIIDWLMLVNSKQDFPCDILFRFRYNICTIYSCIRTGYCNSYFPWWIGDLGVMFPLLYDLCYCFAFFLFGHGTRLRGKTYTSISAKGVDDILFLSFS
jgi:hypothetical protein